MRHEPTAQAMHAPFAASGWGPWTNDATDMQDPSEGPGLLVSRAFWVGGGLSVLLWGGVTLLALRWV